MTIQSNFFTSVFNPKLESKSIQSPPPPTLYFGNAPKQGFFLWSPPFVEAFLRTRVFIFRFIFPMDTTNNCLEWSVSVVSGCGLLCTFNQSPGDYDCFLVLIIIVNHRLMLDFWEMYLWCFPFFFCKKHLPADTWLLVLRWLCLSPL